MQEFEGDIAKSEAIFEQLRLFKVNKTKHMIIKEILKLLQVEADLKEKINAALEPEQLTPPRRQSMRRESVFSRTKTLRSNHNEDYILN